MPRVERRRPRGRGDAAAESPRDEGATEPEGGVLPPSVASDTSPAPAQSCSDSGDRQIGVIGLSSEVQEWPTGPVGVGNPDLSFGTCP